MIEKFSLSERGQKEFRKLMKMEVRGRINIHRRSKGT